MGACLGIVEENVAAYERTRDALAAGESLTVERIPGLCDDMVRAHADRLQPALRAALGS